VSRTGCEDILHMYEYTHSESLENYLMGTCLAHTDDGCTSSQVTGHYVGRAQDTGDDGPL
jgi:hypothetical protein